MEDVFSKFNTVRPPELDVKEEEPTTPTADELAGEEAKPTEPVEEVKSEPKVEETPTVSSQTQEIKDTFFEDFNKRFGTQYKDESEIKSLFELPKKVTDYEGRLKDKDELAKSVEQYKKEIDDLKKTEDPLKYFSSPEAFIAEQLRKKYPTRNPQLLYEVATTEVDNMDDFDVLVKEKQLFIPKLAKEGDVKGVLFKKYGIDAETPPEEWDSVVKTEIAIDAAAARDKINGLKKEIELPQIVSKEDKERLQADELAKKQGLLSPLKQEFSKFDKIKFGDIEYTVPAEYKEGLGDMFDAYFINAGNEVTEENLTDLAELRDAIFIKRNMDGIIQAVIKDAQTKLRAELDKELGNTDLPNTATASDQAGTRDEKPGWERFIDDQRGYRVSKL